MKQLPKILVIGHGRHGKDTVGDMISSYLGRIAIPSSMHAAKVLKPVLDIVLEPKTISEHYRDRVKHRELYFQLISLYNSYDKAAFVKYVLERQYLYTGLRCDKEYDACVEQDLFDHVVYVDASKRVDYVDPTFHVKYNPDTMTYMPNNGDEDALARHVYLFIKQFNLGDKL